MVFPKEYKIFKYVTGNPIRNQWRHVIVAATQKMYHMCSIIYIYIRTSLIPCRLFSVFPICKRSTKHCTCNKLRAVGAHFKKSYTSVQSVPSVQKRLSANSCAGLEPSLCISVKLPRFDQKRPVCYMFVLN